MGIVREWAGREREFALPLGRVMDLEEARGEGIGAIFQRVSTGRFYASDIFHTIRLALIGGGASLVEAKRLMDQHFDTRPYLENAQIAGDILLSIMAGVEPSEASGSDAQPAPLKFSEVSQICATFHLSPLDLRAMRYADFVNMVRGFNAKSGGPKADFLTEEEFDELLAKYEPEALNGADR